MSADAIDLAKIKTWALDLVEDFKKDEADWALNMMLSYDELDGGSPVTTILALVAELETCHAILHAAERRGAEHDAANRVIAAACAYIHGGSDDRQKNYTAWRNTYRDVFAEWPASQHPIEKGTTS